jgi:hypothetical protein
MTVALLVRFLQARAANNAYRRSQGSQWRTAASDNGARVDLFLILAAACRSESIDLKPMIV